MKNIIVMTAVALAAWTAAFQAQEQATPVAAPTRSGLSYLDAVTFGGPKAALNAAARKAATAPSQGTYQFSYFRTISDSHHASYEVHFKSNYEGEADLKYCVEMYCQQGWDPKTAKATITLMSNNRQAHPDAGACSAHQPPVKRTTK